MYDGFPCMEICFALQLEDQRCPQHWTLEDFTHCIRRNVHVHMTSS